MKVRSDFLTQLSRYVNGEMDLNSFREWHLAELAQAQNLSKEDEALLYAVQTQFSDLLAGVPESSVKDSLKTVVGFLQSSNQPTQGYTFVFPNLEPQTTSRNTSSSGSYNPVDQSKTRVSA